MQIRSGIDVLLFLTRQQECAAKVRRHGRRPGHPRVAFVTVPLVLLDHAVPDAGQRRGVVGQSGLLHRSVPVRRAADAAHPRRHSARRRRRHPLLHHAPVGEDYLSQRKLG